MDFIKHVLHFDVLTSTNTYLKDHAAHLHDGTAVTADQQTAGKGRLGRSWESVPNQALYQSFLFKNPDWDITLLPLISALAAAQATEQLIGQAVQIKWPNDLVFHHKKICGILCESVLQAKNRIVISGIGINLNQSQEHFRVQDLPHATSLLAELGAEYSVKECSYFLCQWMDKILLQYAQQGFISLKQDYLNRLINLGHEVQIVYEQTIIIAKAVGIADNGNLLCEYHGKMLSIHSGEASVRGLYGYV